MNSNTLKESINKILIDMAEVSRRYMFKELGPLSEAAQRLTSAWQMMKETEIHEEYHMNGNDVMGSQPIEPTDLM